MKRKVKRATREEILAFENSTKSQACYARDGEWSSGDPCCPCVCNFTWLDDTALAALPHDALLKAAAQYRDIIMGLLEEKKELTGAFRTVLERNNILITDVFGRKNEKLVVLLGGSQPQGGQSREDDDDEWNVNVDVPVKSSDRDAENHGEGQEGTGHASAEEDEAGKKGSEPEGKKGRTWKPVRSPGCLDRQCRELPAVERTIEMTDAELESIFGKGNYRRMEGNDKEIIEYEYIPRTLYVRKTVLCAYGAVDKEAECVQKEMAVAKNPVVRLRSHSRVTSSVWAFVLSQRYFLRLPWERVSSDLAGSGLSLTPQMMEENARFFFGILTALIQRIWYHLFLTGHIQIDETPVLVYDQAEKVLRRCYMWVFTVSELFETDRPVTIFVYAAGRGHK